MFALFVLPAAAQQRSLLEVSAEGAKAYREGRYQDYLRLAEELRQIAPNHTQVLWAVARANARVGNAERAIEVLSRLADMEAYFDAAASPDFEALRGREDFRQAVARLDALKKPVANSAVAFILSDRELIPESIAYDPKDGGFFVGSIYQRAIVKRGKDGKVVAFVATARDGLGGVLGIKLDARRRELWANACNLGKDMTMSPADPQSEGESAIFRFHADTGKLIAKYQVGTKEKPQCVNDLVISPTTGDVFATGGKGPLEGHILRVARGGDAAEVYFTPEGSNHGFNGITISDDGKTLYLADNIYGVMAVDVASRRGRLLPAPENTAMEQIDGLYFYRGSLVAVQNARSLMRVAQFTLDGERITGHRTLERNNPHFTVPTTGVLVGHELYYVANTELDALNPEGGLKGTPKEPVILRVKLGE
jgi:sugar lactone lactonase YvrE